jgi:hypothetical protein
MENYNIPKNDYQPTIRKEVIQTLIDFYLTHFGGDWFNGVWKVGQTSGLYIEDGKYHIWNNGYKSNTIRVTNEELKEFARVWTASGYFISTCIDSKFGWREFAFTKEPYTSYDYRLIDSINRYL